MKNDYKVRGEVTAIFLSRRDGSIVETIIDTEQLERADQFEGMWCLSFQHRGYYVTGREPGSGSKGKMRRLHRWLLDAPDGLVVDHINGDTLNNRLNNLRIVDYIANGQNRTRLNKNNKSGYRGVTWDKRFNKWFTQIQVNRKTINLGHYDSIEEAVKVVENARLKHMPYSKEAENA